MSSSFFNFIDTYFTPQFIDASNKPISHLSAFAFGVLTMRASIEYRNGSEEFSYFAFASFLLGLQTLVFYFAPPISPLFPFPKFPKVKKME
jgi:hypothetical protein